MPPNNESDQRKDHFMQGRTDISGETKPATMKSLGPRLVPLVLIAVAALIVWQSGVLDYISLEELAENREILKAWVSVNFLIAILAYSLLYAIVVALSLPVATPLTLAGGFLFGWLVGGIATVSAATMGAVAIFLLAKTALAGPLARQAGPWLDKLRVGFQEDAISYLLFLRLVPAFPFWLVNLAPALLGVKFRDFAVTTFIGIIPGTFAIALTGAGLDSVLVAHMQAYRQCLAQNSAADACSFGLDASSLLTPQLLAAFAALGVVALIPAIVKRIWRRKPGKA